MNKKNLGQIFADDPEILDIFVQKEKSQLLGKILEETQKDEKKSTIEIFAELIRGEKGDRGETGEQGEPGEMGMRGLDGDQGKDGKNGKNGKDGKQGVKGDKGDKGEKGDDGKNPDPKEVIAEIKKLKGNDRLDISNIRNGEQLASLAAKASGGFNMNDQRWHGAGGSGSGGSSELNIITVTSNYSMTNTNDVVWVDSTSGDVTITLPPFATAKNKVFTVRRLDNSGNDVIIDGNGTTINGQTTKSIAFQYTSVDLLTNNVIWQIK